MVELSWLQFTTTAASFSSASASGSSDADGTGDVRTLTLQLSGRTVVYESPLRHDRYDAAYQMLRAAAARGDNVGSDEYPTYEYFRNKLLDRASASACLIDVATSGCEEGGARKAGEPVGFVTVVPSRYSRSFSPIMCSVVPVVSPLSCSDKTASGVLYRDLVRIGTSLAATSGAVHPKRSLGFNYRACVADVFITNLRQLKAFRDEGFCITACIPNAGKLHGSSAKHVDSYIMYKELTDASSLNDGSSQPPQFPTPGANEDAVDVASSSSSSINFASVNLLPVPGLPRRFALSDGTQLNVRHLRHDDIPPFYAVMRSAIDAGLGYGADEMPNLRYFVDNYINGWHNVVYELADTEEPVTYANFLGPTPFSRSVDDPVIADGGNMVIIDKYRGRHWYWDMTKFTLDLMMNHVAESGRIVGLETDMDVTNFPAIQLTRNLGAMFNGVLPSSIYYKDSGWTDVALYFLPARLWKRGNR